MTTAESNAAAVSLATAINADIIKAVKLSKDANTITRVFATVADALFKQLKIANDNWQKAVEANGGDYIPFTCAMVRDKKSGDVEAVFAQLAAIEQSPELEVLMYIE